MRFRFLNDMVESRKTWKWLIGHGSDKSACMKNYNKVTVMLINEIRDTERKLNRPHRYLPQAGFYQGRM